jgi:hypothetical protein
MRPRTPKLIVALAFATAAVGVFCTAGTDAQDSAKKAASTSDVVARVGGQNIDRAAALEEAKTSL